MTAWWKALSPAKREAAETIMGEALAGLVAMLVARVTFARWRESGYALDRKGAGRALIVLRYLATEVAFAEKQARKRARRVDAALRATRGSP